MAETRTTRRLTRFRTPMAVAALAVVVVVALIVIVFTAGGDEPTAAEEPPRTVQQIAGLPQEGQRLGTRIAPVTVTMWVDMLSVGYRRDLDRLTALVPDVRLGEVKLVLRQWDLLGAEPPSAALATLAAAEQQRYWDYAITFAARFDPVLDEPRQYDDVLPEVARDVELDVDKWNEDRQALRDRYLNDEQVLGGEQARELGFQQPGAVLVRGPEGTRRFEQVPTAAELLRAVAAVS